MKNTIFTTGENIGKLLLTVLLVALLVLPAPMSVNAAAKKTQNPASTATVTYVGNKNSKKFHYPNCSSVSDMKDSNKVYFYGTRDEPVTDGYTPCKRCKP
jgi:DNA-entry nuclease